MNRKYIKPLMACNKALSETEGINYIILVSDAIKDGDVETFSAGSGWNVEYEDGGPDFMSMVGGLIEHFLSNSSLSYTDKLKLLREFNDELLKHITNEEDE